MHAGSSSIILITFIFINTMAPPKTENIPAFNWFNFFIDTILKAKGQPRLTWQPRDPPTSVVKATKVPPQLLLQPRFALDCCATKAGQLSKLKISFLYSFSDLIINQKNFLLLVYIKLVPPFNSDCNLQQMTRTGALVCLYFINNQLNH